MAPSPTPPQYAIAIDGTAASGKSTVAKSLAERLGISYLDTGKLYRAVALAFLQDSTLRPEEWTKDSAEALLAATTLEVKPDRGCECRVYMEGRDVTDDLGAPVVEQATPFAARLPSVRAWLLDLQRDLSQQHSVVMAGRDIGTVVLPEAQLKVYMVADLRERARRRLLQRGTHFGPVELEQAVSDLAARDERDAQRECAPMVAAEDALQLDSTAYTPEELVNLILGQLEANLKSS